MMKWQSELEFKKAEYSDISGTLFIWRKQEDVEVRSEMKRKSQGFEPEALWYPFKWHCQHLGISAADIEYHIHYYGFFLSHWSLGYESLLKAFLKATRIKEKFPEERFMLRFTRGHIDIRYELNEVESYYWLTHYARQVMNTLRSVYDEYAFAYEQWDSCTKGQLR